MAGFITMRLGLRRENPRSVKHDDHCDSVIPFQGSSLHDERREREKFIHGTGRGGS
jgi:hypothetical protein